MKTPRINIENSFSPDEALSKNRNALFKPSNSPLNVKFSIYKKKNPDLQSSSFLTCFHTKTWWQGVVVVKNNVLMSLVECRRAKCSWLCCSLVWLVCYILDNKEFNYLSTAQLTHILCVCVVKSGVDKNSFSWKWKTCKCVVRRSKNFCTA